jgi:hypothetical protein
MADTAAAPAPSAAPSPKKRAAGKAKAKAAPSHPKTADMVNAAITNLKERGGSSLQAIKKYIAATYKVDVEKLAPFIRKYLKSGVSNGALLQTKGKGASGSFKLSASSGKSEKKAVSSKPKSGGAKKAKKPKSPTKSKPAASKPAKKKPKQASKVKKPKSPKKEKKAKTPKKPKSPKPKKSAKPKKAPAKK